EMVGAPASRAFALGRQALVILLRAIGVRKGDRVGVCGFTCLSVVEAVKDCGAVPVYLDIDETLCISPEAIGRCRPGSLRAVLLQHTLGFPGKLDELLSACAAIGADVIEDCAHAMGCFWKRKRLGQFGLGAIYSFQWEKPYTTGQGGMLTVNSASLLARVEEEITRWAVPLSRADDWKLECQRRIHSLLKAFGLETRARNHWHWFGSGDVPEELQDLTDAFLLYPGCIQPAGERMSAAGLSRLKDWPRIQQIRRDNVALICEAFARAGLPLWPVPPEADCTLLRYPLLMARKAEILAEARRNNLDIAGWYHSPVHPLPPQILAQVDYRAGDCPQSESLIARLVHIPTGTGLRRKTLDRIVGLLAAKERL
ncbi:MAG: DegT/DnrJ/EryC1/StrS aminotransferase family protein, partial [Phycisphaerae bacterium]|nr:DegT/DnrJ/EryC1/StrS aminotransferase family protein [Phycisphaerae bacterium]